MRTANRSRSRNPACPNSYDNVIRAPGTAAAITSAAASSWSANIGDPAAVTTKLATPHDAANTPIASVSNGAIGSPVRLCPPRTITETPGGPREGGHGRPIRTAATGVSETASRSTATHTASTNGV
ncbi:hypothetical protein GCM10029964_037930 [Kibdelosporangium lantanae]